MLPTQLYKRLSKTMSHALRHAPEQYGLTLDTEGWVDVDALIAAVRQRRGWATLEQADIERMMAAADKQRYELIGDKIRAQYGHSVVQKIRKTPSEPPEILYHGPFPKAAVIIIKEGLKPMRRQYVHLAADVETATIVGKRHANAPVILRVQARQAFAAGINFYTEPNGIWLADAIAPQFIESSL